MTTKRLIALLTLCLTLTIGCKHEHDHAHDHDHKGHKHEKGGHGGHSHSAPHGGTLIPLGDHFANAEVTLNNKGLLTLYVLDGHASKGVPAPQASVTLSVSHEKVSFDLVLGGVANALTGETVNKTSQFSVTDKRLIKTKSFKGVIKSLKVKGKEFKDVAFTIK